MSESFRMAIREALRTAPVFPVKQGPKRMRRKPGMKQCSRCGGERDRPTQRFCRPCHNAYMKVWRREHPRTGTRRREGA